MLVEPRPGDEFSDPLAVGGYSCNFGASDTIILETPGGERVRKTVTGNDWSRTWGYFEATLDLPPFSVVRASCGSGPRAPVRAL